jgi:hypothetical protein
MVTWQLAEKKLVENLDYLKQSQSVSVVTCSTLP